MVVTAKVTDSSIRKQSIETNKSETLAIEIMDGPARAGFDRIRADGGLCGGSGGGDYAGSCKQHQHDIFKDHITLLNGGGGVGRGLESTSNHANSLKWMFAAVRSFFPQSAPADAGR